MSHEVPPDMLQGLLCVSGDLRSLGKPIKGHLSMSLGLARLLLFQSLED